MSILKKFLPVIFLTLLQMPAWFALQAQAVEVQGSLRIDNVETDSFESTIVVLQPDGTITKREIESIIIKVLIGNGTANIQNLLNAGYTVQMLMEAGVTRVQLYGKTYQGGLIYYIDTTNYTGLVASTVNQGTAAWGCSGVVTGATGLVIGTGMANTDSIELHCPTLGIAADLCANLVLNGYDDWFLPSLDELERMYFNLHLNGHGGFTNFRYWSSSESISDPFDVAWDLNFNGGSALFANKGISRTVRAARKFFSQ